MGGRTDSYPSYTIHDTDSGDLEGLELGRLDLIVVRVAIRIQCLGNRSDIVDIYPRST